MSDFYRPKKTIGPNCVAQNHDGRRCTRHGSYYDQHHHGYVCYLHLGTAEPRSSPTKETREATRTDHV